jgi:hypothetical protein
MSIAFVQLNDGWNAEPNTPDVGVAVKGEIVSVRFVLNHFVFPKFEEGEEATLMFHGTERYRYGPTNDEGWYKGQCRFSRLAPRWGEFYEVSGDPELQFAPGDWRAHGPSTDDGRHFLFYFRDGTFECVARECTLELPANKAVNTDAQMRPLPSVAPGFVRRLRLR